MGVHYDTRKDCERHSSCDVAPCLAVRVHCLYGNRRHFKDKKGMKANELMIGDILNLSDNDKDIIPCKVVELYTEELLVIQPGDTACDIVGYDMVKPLPLTAEILEKKGWKEYPQVYSNQKALNFDIYRFEDEVGIKIQGNCIVLNYVHELQHALRLCGLDDLANNFKV